MKRFMILLIMGILLAACSIDGDTASNSQQNEENGAMDKVQETGNKDDDLGEKTSESATTSGTIDSKEFEKIFSNPKEYKGYEVDFTGKVFIQPERDSDGTYLQIFADPENHDQNVLVGMGDPDLDVAVDDYVSVKGVIMDEFEGQNAFGGMILAPTVRAESIEVVDYVTAVSPAIETIAVDQSQDQHGYVVQVEKLEIAGTMTRLYVTVTNNTDDEISFYTFNSRLLIGNQQLEEEMGFFDTGLPELQSSILPGVETEGVIIFPPIDPETASLKFHAEGSSSNYQLDFEPFVFEIGK